MKHITINRSGKVFLTLENKAYKGSRCLGDIDKDTFHCERNPERHIFRQFGGSYGFNYELLRDGNFKYVIVHLPFGKRLITTRKHILNKGHMLNFQKNQLERQIFLPLSEFGLDKAEESSRGTPPTTPVPTIQLQISLFGGQQ